MDLVIGGIIGLAVLALLVWAVGRLRSRLDDRPYSDRQAMDEAEALTRSRGPYV